MTQWTGSAQYAVYHLAVRDPGCGTRHRVFGGAPGHGGGGGSWGACRSGTGAAIDRRRAGAAGGITSLLASGVVRSLFAQIGGAWLVGVWPIAHMSIHTCLTVPVRTSGSIRKKYPTCGGVSAPVFCVQKMVLFVRLTRRDAMLAYCSWFARTKGGRRPPVLRTCHPRRGERRNFFFAVCSTD